MVTSKVHCGPTKSHDQSSLHKWWNALYNIYIVNTALTAQCSHKFSVRVDTNEKKQQQSPAKRQARDSRIAHFDLCRAYISQNHSKTNDRVNRNDQAKANTKQPNCGLEALSTITILLLFTFRRLEFRFTLFFSVSLLLFLFFFLILCQQNWATMHTAIWSWRSNEGKMKRWREKKLHLSFCFP